MLNVCQALLDFIFPPHCPICGAYVETQGGFCPECLAGALDVRPLALPPDSPLAGAWALGHYRGGLAALIKRLKYKGQRSALPYFRTFLEACENKLPQGLHGILAPGSGWLLVPVPLHKDKEKQRGFNQAELIFHDWLAARGLSTQPLLRRCRPTRPMYELSAGERRQNLKGAFVLADEEAKQAAGKSGILLLDDIITTGSTLSECARVLRKAGAARVEALVVASDKE